MQKISVLGLKFFQNHLSYVLQDEEMDRLYRNMKEYGEFSLLMARIVESCYDIASGD